MSVLNLQPLAADPLLGLMSAYREDTRPDKMDLGVGVYRDDNGRTPIMQAVRSAEEFLKDNQQTKAYEGPRGNLGFCAEIQKLVFGKTLSKLDERVTNLATPGGCGALYLGIQLAKRTSDAPSIWVSNPTWPNHTHIVKSSSLPLSTYRYLNPNTYELAFEEMIADLKQSKKGDIVILQGPCHNPSGVDLGQEHWRELSRLSNEIGFLPFIDIAYHGLGAGLDEDLSGVREALTTLPEAMISYSCSKNFGLYRERTGSLLLLAQTRANAEAAGTHLADISRASYSMPPAHGAAIVEAILGNDSLRHAWAEELVAMRLRITGLRTQLAKALTNTSQQSSLARIEREQGMFSLLPLNPQEIAHLIDAYGIYLPNSGRINIAGMRRDEAQPFAKAIQRVTASS